MTQPALFKYLRPLSRDTDQALRLQPNQPYQFAADQQLSPIVASEAMLVAREYAFAFGAVASSLPVALLGAQPGRNAYVRASGHWIARYVPANIRRYPFLLADNTAPDAMRNPATRGRDLIVLVDQEAPHFVAQGGQPLFSESGEPSEVLQQVKKTLAALDQEGRRTQALVRQIEKADLLMAKTLEIRQRQANTVGLQGLRVVDTTRLNALSAGALHSLHGSGALALIQAHVLSLSNLQDGALTHTSPADGPKPEMGEISFEGIDWSKF